MSNYNASLSKIGDILMLLTKSTIRLKERELDLTNIFTITSMKSAWKDTVRDGLRKQEVTDLHDYYDFHKNKDSLMNVIINQVTTGVYYSKQPYIIRVEKGNGISRHLQIPSPQDAIVLQTIVNGISPIILSKQPSKQSYFSRSHKRKTIEDIDDSFPYDWRQLWPDFQSRIWDFTNSYNFVVVTDIANFYDNISMSRLRNVLSSYGTIKETLLDFLFYMLESFIWRPDYLPFSGVGLPQINFDAPRLLAHSFLYEIDRYLDKSTKGDFVRWMDDIDFGVKDIDTGRRILRHLDELLLTRGLRLNTGKTGILSSQEAKLYFYPNDNRYLTILGKRIDRKMSQNKNIDKEILWLRQRFIKFMKSDKKGYWDKVYKRFFTLASKCKHSFLEKNVPELLKNNPKLRNTVFFYYKNLGYSKKRLGHLIEFVKFKYIEEDISLFYVAKLLVDWEVPRTGKANLKIVNTFTKGPVNTEIGFLSSLWVLAKYGSNQELIQLINKSTRVWSNSSFLSRQVAAIFPRLKGDNQTIVSLTNILINSGQTEALSIIRNLERLREMTKLNKQDEMYITMKLRSVYPLEKYLILLEIINGNLGKTKKKDLITAVLKVTNDSTLVYNLKKLEKKYKL